MKKCPFCAEEIQDDAVKCRFCGEFLEGNCNRPATKWYFSNLFVVITLLCLGPFALPLVWFNPRYQITTKILVTLSMIALTILFIYLVVYVYCDLMKQVEALGA